MREQMLFNVVILSQVLLVSGCFPALVLRRVRRLMDRYPESEYPRLYTRSSASIATATWVYRGANGAVMLLGLALLAVGIRSPGEEMLIRDNDLVTMAYLGAQLAALLIGPALFFPYFSIHRATDLPATRSAALRPRRVLDYVPTALLGVAIATYIAFFALVFYVRQFDFPWFGGYLNIVIVTASNVFFATLFYRLMYGKRQDPFAPEADRELSLHSAARLLLLTSIGATVFAALTILLQAFGLGALKPTAMSLYIQVLAFASVHALRIDGVNFEVYRAEKLVA